MGSTDRFSVNLLYPRRQWGNHRDIDKCEWQLSQAEEQCECPHKSLDSFSRAGWFHAKAKKWDVHHSVPGHSLLGFLAKSTAFSLSCCPLEKAGYPFTNETVCVCLALSKDVTAEAILAVWKLWSRAWPTGISYSYSEFTDGEEAVLARKHRRWQKAKRTTPRCFSNRDRVRRDA